LVSAGLSKALKEVVDDEGVGLRPSDYMPILKHLDKEQTGLINASDLILFCSRNIPADPVKDDYTFELRYLANIIEFKHNVKNTANYLK